MKSWTHFSFALLAGVFSISLAQPVADILPEWANDGRSRIAAPHLSDMRSGLQAQGFSTKSDQGLDQDNVKSPNILLAGLPEQEQARLSPHPYELDEQLTSITAKDGRVIPLRIIEPSGCKACPLLIFSHGAFSTYDRYDALLVPLARRGFRIIAPNHVDSEEHPDRDAYSQAESMRKRVEDYASIAAEYSADTMIVIGHSYGALIAQLVAGAKLDDAEDCPLLDNLPRPAAVVAISPPGPVPGSISAMGWSEIEIPMLVTTGTTDILPGFIDDWRGHLTSYEAAHAQETYALIYEDMDHYMDGAYGRETNLSGEELASRKAAIDHLVGAIALFADQISIQSAPSAERWKALAGPSLEVLTKMDE